MRLAGYLIVASVALGSVAACGSSPLEDEGDGAGDGSDSGDGSGSSEAEPWTRQFTMGNFALNTGDVLTNQDGVSSTYLADYVLAAALPAANLEVFTIHAYLPSSDLAEPTVSSTRVVVSRTDGTETGDIFQEGTYVEEVDLGDGPYSVFRLTGFTTAQPAITPETFANVRFEIAVDYTDATGRVVHGAMHTLEVYKR